MSDIKQTGNYAKLLKKSIFGVMLLLIVVEVGVRFSGLVDFPIYSIENDIGYIPKPQQSGVFLNKNPWTFNDRSMGTATNWDPKKNPNILLIGNSIVMGGNPYAQKDKLGPLIQQQIGSSYTVWPIATGGWTNVNEVVYLKKNPDVEKSANFYVWEYMSGGLSQLSQARSEYVFPSHKPVWATWYIVRRYILPRFITFNMNELPPTGQTASQYLTQFEEEVAKLSAATGRKTSGILFLYPTQIQLHEQKQGVEWLPERPQLTQIANKYGLQIVDVSRSPEWNESLYREETHPTVAGNVVLAQIIGAGIKRGLGLH